MAECIIGMAGGGMDIKAGCIVVNGSSKETILGGRPKLLLLSSNANAYSPTTGRMELIVMTDTVDCGVYTFTVTDSGFCAGSSNGSSQYWYYWAIM